MQERLLHYIWQQKLFMAFPQYTTNGLPLQVIDPGQYNSDSGPDFFNAKIQIADTYWAGNIEIHNRASDWYLHGHHNDKAYDNVILHVVAHSDVDIRRTDGTLIPQCQLRFPEPIIQRYRNWCNNGEHIPCRDTIKHVPQLFLHNWLEVLAIQRLDDKIGDIRRCLTQCRGGDDEAFYIMLARAFGFHTNSLPFELTAKSLPLQYIERHRGQPRQVEALLFGQAALLNTNDQYGKQLTGEYNFLRHKFSLTPIDHKLWKRLRMRPTGFPELRLAQFAELLLTRQRILSQVIDNPELEALRQLFTVTAPEYWNNHYSLGKIADKSFPKTLGEQSVDNIIINVAAPFIYYCAVKRDDATLAARALTLLTRLPAENNSVIRLWQQAGIKADNALDSQALLQLYNKYCRNRDCLRCRLARQMLKKLEK